MEKTLGAIGAARLTLSSALSRRKLPLYFWRSGTQYHAITSHGAAGAFPSRSEFSEHEGRNHEEINLNKFFGLHSLVVFDVPLLLIFRWSTPRKKIHQVSHKVLALDECDPAPHSRRGFGRTFGMSRLKQPPSSPTFCNCSSWNFRTRTDVRTLSNEDKKGNPS